MADDCQSPIILDFKKSRYLAAADASNATLMLTKSIYSVLLIYSVRPTTIRDHNAGCRDGLFPLSFKYNRSHRYGSLCGEVNIIGFDGSGAIIAYFVNKKDFLCKH